MLNLLVPIQPCHENSSEVIPGTDIAYSKYPKPLEKTNVVFKAAHYSSQFPGFIDHTDNQGSQHIVFRVQTRERFGYGPDMYYLYSEIMWNGQIGHICSIPYYKGEAPFQIVAQEIQVKKSK